MSIVNAVSYLVSELQWEFGIFNVSEVESSGGEREQILVSFEDTPLAALEAENQMI